MLATGLHLLHHRGVAAQLGTHAGGQLGDRDGLDDHVVRPLIEARQAVGLQDGAGHEDHGQGPEDGVRAQLVERLEAVEPRHVEVQDHDGHGSAPRELDRLPTM